jgi:hypothetical protein
LFIQRRHLFAQREDLVAPVPRLAEPGKLGGNAGSSQRRASQAL